MIRLTDSLAFVTYVSAGVRVQQVVELPKRTPVEADR